MFSGAVLGVILWGIASLVYPDLGFGGFPEGLLPVVALPLGALLGDLAGSFIKRRMGKEKGAPVLGLDQYDFFIGAILLTLAVHTDWFVQHYAEGEYIYGLIFIVVLTPFLHRAVNIVGFRLGKKEVPW